MRTVATVLMVMAAAMCGAQAANMRSTSTSGTAAMEELAQKYDYQVPKESWADRSAIPRLLDEIEKRIQKQLNDVTPLYTKEVTELQSLWKDDLRKLEEEKTTAETHYQENLRKARNDFDVAKDKCVEARNNGVQAVQEALLQLTAARTDSIENCDNERSKQIKLAEGELAKVKKTEHAARVAYEAQQKIAEKHESAASEKEGEEEQLQKSNAEQSQVVAAAHSTCVQSATDATTEAMKVLDEARTINTDLLDKELALIETIRAMVAKMAWGGQQIAQEAREQVEEQKEKVETMSQVERMAVLLQLKESVEKQEWLPKISVPKIPKISIPKVSLKKKLADAAKKIAEQAKKTKDAAAKKVKDAASAAAKKAEEGKKAALKIAEQGKKSLEAANKKKAAAAAAAAAVAEQTVKSKASQKLALEKAEQEMKQKKRELEKEKEEDKKEADRQMKREKEQAKKAEESEKREKKADDLAKKSEKEAKEAKKEKEQAEKNAHEVARKAMEVEAEAKKEENAAVDDAKEAAKEAMNRVQKAAEDQQDRANDIVEHAKKQQEKAAEKQEEAEEKQENEAKAADVKAQVLHAKAKAELSQAAEEVAGAKAEKAEQQQSIASIINNLLDKVEKKIRDAKARKAQMYEKKTRALNKVQTDRIAKCVATQKDAESKMQAALTVIQLEAKKLRAVAVSSAQAAAVAKATADAADNQLTMAIETANKLRTAAEEAHRGCKKAADETYEKSRVALVGAGMNPDDGQAKASRFLEIDESKFINMAAFKEAANAVAVKAKASAKSAVKKIAHAAKKVKEAVSIEKKIKPMPVTPGAIQKPGAIQEPAPAERSQMDAIRESYQSCTLSAEKARKDLTDEAEQAMNDAQNTFNVDSKMLVKVFNKHKAALDKKAMDATNWLKADLRLIDRFRSILKIDYQKRREAAPFTPIVFRPSVPAEDEKVSDAAQNAKTNEETEQKEEAVKAQVEEKEAETKAMAESKAEAQKEEQKVEEKEAAHEVEQAKEAAKEAANTKAEEAAEVKDTDEKAADDEKKAADDAIKAATVAAEAKEDPAVANAVASAKIGSSADFSWSAPTGASSSSSTGVNSADDDEESSSMTASTGSSDDNSASSEDMPASDVVKAMEEPNTETPVLRGNQCRCSDVVSPVCGADGVSYANACSAKCKKVEIAHKGKC